MAKKKSAKKRMGCRKRLVSIARVGTTIWSFRVRISKFKTVSAAKLQAGQAQRNILLLWTKRARRANISETHSCCGPSGHQAVLQACSCRHRVCSHTPRADKSNMLYVLHDKLNSPGGGAGTDFQSEVFVSRQLETQGLRI